MLPTDMLAFVQTGKRPQLTPAQQAIRCAYDAPFEGLGYQAMAAPRRFPLSLPFDNPEGGNAAAQARHYEALLKWGKPIHFIWGGKDAVFTEAWGRKWAGCFPQATFDLLPDAGHFLQETQGAKIAEIFISRVAGL